MVAAKGALAEIVEASRAAVSLHELAQAALDGLRRAFDCSLACFTNSPRNGTIEILGATDAGVLGEYRRDWFAADPINDAVRRHGGSWIVPAAGLPEWPQMRRHPLYAEWAPRNNVRHLLHLRLSRARYLDAGAANVFLCRAGRAADFGDRDILALSQVLPDLEIAVRRCQRAAETDSLSPFLEALLSETDGTARLALRMDGRPIWLSRAARKLLAGQVGGASALPGALIRNAQQLARGADSASELRLASSDGGAIHATLRTVAANTGQLFIVADLRVPVAAARGDLRERYGLTSAEASVLGDLGEGLSNAQIAERRRVSVSTIRTHVARILSKLGVRSRLQAVVLMRNDDA